MRGGREKGKEGRKMKRKGKEGRKEVCRKKLSENESEEKRGADRIKKKREEKKE